MQPDLKQPDNSPEPDGEQSLGDIDCDSVARAKITKLWQPGALFHNFARYPAKADGPKVDRLSQILRDGLIAPGSSTDGTVRSDINLVVHGTSIPYHDVVFLHRFGHYSEMYAMLSPGHCTVLVDPALPVLTREDMGIYWFVSCQDEVYVRSRINRHAFRGLVAHHSEAESIVQEFAPVLRELAIPIYLMDGSVVWPRTSTP